MTQTTQVPDDDTVTATRRREVTYWVDERDGAFPLPWWKLAPIVLLVGAAAVAILTLIMIPIYEGQIESGARDELRAAGIDPAPFAFDASYRDLDIRGVLPAGIDVDDVRAAAERTDGLRDLDLDLDPARPAPVVIEDEADDEAVEEEVAATAATEVTATVTDGQVVLTGVVPTEAMRSLLVAQAGRPDASGSPTVDVVDELTVADLAPTTSGANARVLQLGLLLTRLPDGAVGTATITDTTFDSEWTVGSDDDAAAIEATVKAADPAFDEGSNASITVEAPPVDEEIDALQSEFDALSIEIRENVTFATGSDVLNDTATATLDKVVDLMTLYTRPVVEISGHTDDVGNDDANLALSDARAAAVRQYLIDAGIDEARIQSIGKGETEPLESNETAEGRAVNRRVELTALEVFVE